MKESGNENKSLTFILKYFHLGTISSAEVKKYERSRKRTLNVSLGMVIGAENIHYKVLYTEESIIHNSISYGKGKSDNKDKSSTESNKNDRKSTILEKIEFMNNTIQEFNEYYDTDMEINIVTTFDEDIKVIAKKVGNINFEILDKDIIDSIVKENEINNDIFYKEAKESKKIEFKSIVEVKKKVNNIVNPKKYKEYIEY